MKKKKSERARLIASIDKLYSDYVRKKDNYTCQKCGKRSKYVHTAHFFSRNALSTRWSRDPQNACTLCYYCHILWAHRSPLEFADWVKKRIGKDYERLKIKSKKIKKYTIADLKDLKLCLKKLSL